jgi:cytochrome c biogenesis protein
MRAAGIWLFHAGSPRLTLAGFALLALVVWATANDTRVASAWLAVPALLLALNLLAAMVTHPALRRGGLGLFHACLLACMVAAACGRLVHFEGRVEVAQGTLLEARAIEPQSIGPLNDGAWRALRFEQGAWQVHYAPGVRRAHTVSEVRLPGEAAARRFGDTEPLVVDGYRFYTTHNKGFAPMLRWQSTGREAIAGAVHLPSYPLFDWKQEQRWRTPEGVEVKLWLRPDAVLDEREKAPWVLEPTTMAATLVVELDGRRFELRPGDEARTPVGVLRFERLLGWMGYRVYRDPMLEPLFWLALLGIAGLAWHLWPRLLARHGAHGAVGAGIRRVA